MLDPDTDSDADPDLFIFLILHKKIPVNLPLSSNVIRGEIK